MTGGAQGSENGPAVGVDDASPAPAPPVLAVTDLTKRFRLRGASARGAATWLVAVDGVSFEVRKGETWGLVGESGSGKSTTARVVLRLLRPDHGTIEFDGQDITTMNGAPLRRLRAEMQPVFQDVAGSLDPRMRVIDLVAEPLHAHRHELSRTAKQELAGDMLKTMGIVGSAHHRYPYELSGGQRQRVALARALVLRPKLLVLDEPTSALDVSTRAQVSELLRQLQSLGTAFVMVSHDLEFVHYLCDRIAVMYLGQIVEQGSASQVYFAPRHPYTEALLSAVPQIRTNGVGKAERIVLTGEVPDPTDIPSGCRFHTRCPYAWDRCTVEIPPLRALGDGGSVACHLHDDGPQLEGRSVRGLPVVKDPDEQRRGSKI